MSPPSSSTRKGKALEHRIFYLFQNLIDTGQFWAKTENCKLFWQKGYYSKDRQSDIVFDVAIEIYLPGAQDYSSLVLVECKNYSHPVPVDDVEEFFTKVQQVAAANSKAILASTASFQSGAMSFAKSKGMGLMRYFDAEDFKWALHRSSSAVAKPTPEEERYLVVAGLTQEEFRSLAFDLYMQSPKCETNSLWDFFEDLLLGSALTVIEARSVSNPRIKFANQVPFSTKEDLESQSAEILAELGYVGGELNLHKLCAHETQRVGLAVKTGVVLSGSVLPGSVLGRISFDPLVIEVFAQESSNGGRERFTLAHELAHHLLNHGRYLLHESCDDSDFVLRHSLIADRTSDVVRMEFQANYLAASLLMPRAYFIRDFQYLVRSLDIPNKGFGALYLDNQPCNLQNFETVSGQLMQKYGVSRSAVKIRLESMDLLRDKRVRSGLRPVQEFL